MDSRYTTRHSVILLIFAAVLLAATSCGPRPTPDHSMATVAALATDTARLNAQVSTQAAMMARQATEVSAQGTVIAYLATRIGPRPLGTATPIPTGTPYSTPEATGTPGTPMPLQLTLTPAARLSATPPVGHVGYPPDTRVGIPIFDAIVAAVSANDQARLRGLVHYADVGCTLAMGLGGPPTCKLNETAGTLVKALPVLSQEGGAVRPEEVHEVLPKESYSLYAAYRNPRETYAMDEWWLPAKYSLVFVLEPFASGMAVLADDSGIVRVVIAYSRDELLSMVSGDVLLPPLVEPK